MGDQREDAILERLAEVHSAHKSFDSQPSWETYDVKTTTRIRLHASIRLNGRLGGGVFVRLTTPTTSWEGDLYGHIEVQKPAKGCWRVDPIEWRPLRPHTNGKDAPADHRLITLTDRMHPFALNRRYGLQVFEQGAVGVAVDFPRAVSTFEEYLDLCSEVWNFPALKDIAPPQWTMLLV